MFLDFLGGIFFEEFPKRAIGVILMRYRVEVFGMYESGFFFYNDCGKLILGKWGFSGLFLA